MLKRKTYLALAAAAFVASPVATKAATIALSYDANDIQFSIDGGTTFTPAPFVPATNTVTVPAGSILEFGVDVSVTGNPNPAGGIAGGTAGDASTYNRTKKTQPAQLGVGAYGFGLTDSNHNVASVLDISGTGGTTTSAKGAATSSWDSFNSGNVDDAGGGIILSQGEFYLVNAKAHTSTGNAAANFGFFGAGTVGASGELMNGLQINATTAGQAVFTPNDPVATGQLALVAYNAGGSSTATAGAPSYKNVTVVGGDGNTVTNLPALTVVVTPAVTTGQNIISLTAAAPTTYGSNEGTLTVVGHNGGYVAQKVTFPSTGTAFVEGKGFNPATDPEIYGLDVSGTTPTTLAALVADINAQDPGLASLTYPGQGVSPLGPEINLYLDFTTGLGTGDNFMGFDLTQADPTNTGDTISEVALVPEPVSASTLLLGASGLLLGRRKRKA